MEIAAAPASAHLDVRRPFPTASLAWFVSGAVVLRLLAMPAWMFFPERGVFAHSARVFIPLLVVAGLIILNRTFLKRDGFPRDALGLGLRRIGWLFAGGIMIVPIILAMAGTLWVWLGVSIPVAVTGALIVKRFRRKPGYCQAWL